MLQDDFQITVTGPEGYVEDQNSVDQYLEHFRTQILDHFQQSPEFFRAADLNINLKDFTARRYGKGVMWYSLRWEIEAYVTGTVNGMEFECPVYIKNEFNVRKIGLISLHRMLTEGWDLYSVYANNYDLAGDHPKVKVTIADITNQVLIALDQRVGRPQAPTTKRIYALCWSLAILSALCVFFYMLFIGGDSANPSVSQLSKLITSGIFGFLSGVTVFAIVFFVSFLLQPGDYFVKDPAGRKLLHLSGAKSVFVVRLALLFGLSTIVFIICFVTAQFV
ncbi:MAG: hypothetical protein CME31_16440 [Gimesia sp.]|uniref:Uncharacterized protein n=1 Tax=Gimesia maris TaxID=122 RepID=A0A3D3RHL4_9PLAN|nr:hypothetical protein [Gimesia sp.]HCO27110.1 hypothetical protein [Gimesia maris]|tara:strand:- start:45691 stop:46524 length:834 start_codon:yes stop_codon:yes gene_type:complete